MPKIKPRLLIATILATTGILLLVKQIQTFEPFLGQNESTQESQKVFKSTETVSLAYTFTPNIWEPTKESFSLDNLKSLTVFADEYQYQTRLLNANGSEVDVPIQLHANPFGTVQVEIPPSRRIQPGSYQLEVTYNNKTQVQNFSWGVLAVNTNKSVYSPYELNCYSCIGRVRRNGV
ncbi:hypothetical protein KC573_01685 [candidate division WWE3 bacterium]|uniref:Uncharacterized protein n=1 Tax=candidate division WWE3 bacterium TaxID=2053526 RepID=A0A955LWJ3_UNCKA|nr:hypothetical protein [candidate division WWE3 bacterium]